MDWIRSQTTPAQDKAAKLTHRRLLLILALALLLRLAFGLAKDPLLPYYDLGGDSLWYLGTAYAIVTDTPPQGSASDGANLTPPPLYFLLIGIPQALLSPAGAVMAIRVFQAILGTATCYFAYRLALLLTKRTSAGLIAAGALAISPAFIIEAAQILTETTYIFLIAGGMWLYLESFGRHDKGGVRTGAPETRPDAVPDPQSRRGGLALLLIAAALFGLATLTRAVLLAFPLALAAYLLITRQSWRRAALFLLVYGLVVSTWTVYSLARWNRFVIAGNGLEAMFYIGATGWSGPQGTDQQLAEVSPELDYTEGAQAAIGQDPLGWIRRRVGELAGAYLQPHGTTFYPGESLRDLALQWLREDRSVRGLIALTRGDAFWPKLVLYGMHYAALIVGLAGMWVYRRRWQIALPMIGSIAYLTLVHLLLLALPRYLFPNEIFWWIFAAAALSQLLLPRRGGECIKE